MISHRKYWRDFANFRISNATELAKMHLCWRYTLRVGFCMHPCKQASYDNYSKLFHILWKTIEIIGEILQTFGFQMSGSWLKCISVDVIRCVLGFVCMFANRIL